MYYNIKLTENQIALAKRAYFIPRLSWESADPVIIPPANSVTIVTFVPGIVGPMALEMAKTPGYKFIADFVTGKNLGTRFDAEIFVLYKEATRVINALKKALEWHNRKKNGKENDRAAKAIRSFIATQQYYAKKATADAKKVLKRALRDLLGSIPVTPELVHKQSISAGLNPDLEELPVAKKYPKAFLDISELFHWGQIINDVPELALQANDLFELGDPNDPDIEKNLKEVLASLNEVKNKIFDTDGNPVCLLAENLHEGFIRKCPVLGQLIHATFQRRLVLDKNSIWLQSFRVRTVGKNRRVVEPVPVLGYECRAQRAGVFQVNKAGTEYSLMRKDLSGAIVEKRVERAYVDRCVISAQDNAVMAQIVENFYACSIIINGELTLVGRQLKADPKEEDDAKWEVDYYIDFSNNHKYSPDEFERLKALDSGHKEMILGASTPSKVRAVEADMVVIGKDDHGIPLSVYQCNKLFYERLDQAGYGALSIAQAAFNDETVIAVDSKKRYIGSVLKMYNRAPQLLMDSRAFGKSKKYCIYCSEFADGKNDGGFFISSSYLKREAETHGYHLDEKDICGKTVQCRPALLKGNAFVISGYNMETLLTEQGTANGGNTERYIFITDDPVEDSVKAQITAKFTGKTVEFVQFNDTDPQGNFVVDKLCVQAFAGNLGNTALVVGTTELKNVEFAADMSVVKLMHNIRIANDDGGVEISVKETSHHAKTKVHANKQFLQALIRDDESLEALFQKGLTLLKDKFADVINGDVMTFDDVQEWYSSAIVDKLIGAKRADVKSQAAELQDIVRSFVNDVNKLGQLEVDGRFVVGLYDLANLFDEQILEKGEIYLPGENPWLKDEQGNYILDADGNRIHRTVFIGRNPMASPKEGYIATLISLEEILERIDRLGLSYRVRRFLRESFSSMKRGLLVGPSSDPDFVRLLGGADWDGDAFTVVMEKFFVEAMKKVKRIAIDYTKNQSTQIAKYDFHWGRKAFIQYVLNENMSIGELSLRDYAINGVLACLLNDRYALKTVKLFTKIAGARRITLTGMGTYRRRYAKDLEVAIVSPEIMAATEKAIMKAELRLKNDESNFDKVRNNLVAILEDMLIIDSGTSGMTIDAGKDIANISVVCEDLMKVFRAGMQEKFAISYENAKDPKDPFNYKLVVGSEESGVDVRDYFSFVSVTATEYKEYSYLDVFKKLLSVDTAGNMVYAVNDFKKGEKLSDIMNRQSSNLQEDREETRVDRVLYTVDPLFKIEIKLLLAIVSILEGGRRRLAELLKNGIPRIEVLDKKLTLEQKNFFSYQAFLAKEFSRDGKDIRPYIVNYTRWYGKQIGLNPVELAGAVYNASLWKESVTSTDVNLNSMLRHAGIGSFYTWFAQEQYLIALSNLGFLKADWNDSNIEDVPVVEKELMLHKHARLSVGDKLYFNQGVAELPDSNVDLGHVRAQGKPVDDNFTGIATVTAINQRAELVKVAMPLAAYSNCRLQQIAQQVDSEKPVLFKVTFDSDRHAADDLTAAKLCCLIGNESGVIEASGTAMYLKFGDEEFKVGAPRSMPGEENVDNDILNKLLDGRKFKVNDVIVRPNKNGVDQVYLAACLSDDIVKYDEATVPVSEMAPMTDAEMDELVDIGNVFYN